MEMQILFSHVTADKNFFNSQMPKGVGFCLCQTSCQVELKGAQMPWGTITCYLNLLR